MLFFKTKVDDLRVENRHLSLVVQLRWMWGGNAGSIKIAVDEFISEFQLMFGTAVQYTQPPMPDEYNEHTRRAPPPTLFTLTPLHTLPPGAPSSNSVKRCHDNIIQLNAPPGLPAINWNVQAPHYDCYEYDCSASEAWGLVSVGVQKLMVVLPTARWYYGDTPTQQSELLPSESRCDLMQQYDEHRSSICELSASEAPEVCYVHAKKLRMFETLEAWHSEGGC